MKFTEKFNDTEPGAIGQLPGEDPATLHKYFKDNLIRASVSGGTSLLRVQSSGLYITLDGSGWATLTVSPGTQFLEVPFGDHYYIVVASGPWIGYYLSYNINNYIGAYYKWLSSTYWDVQPLNSTYAPGIYPYGDGYLCVGGVSTGADLVEIYNA